jgi:uncharacterized protein (TIGR03437 family)
VNAGGNQPGGSPGAWITIYGFRLATGDLSGGRLPTSLDGVSVMVNGKSAYVYYISPNQLNVLAPPDLLSGTVQVVVSNPLGTSNATTVELRDALPGFFRLADEYITATTPDGRYVGPENLLDGVATTPARPLDTVVLWGTGFGPVNPAAIPGETIENARPLLNPVTLRIGHAPAQVLYAGMSSAGVYQLNVVVPDLSDGDYPVFAEVAGVRTASVARLRIQR